MEDMPKRELTARLLRVDVLEGLRGGATTSAGTVAWGSRRRAYHGAEAVSWPRRPSREATPQAQLHRRGVGDDICHVSKTSRSGHQRPLLNHHCTADHRARLCVIMGLSAVRLSMPRALQPCRSPGISHHPSHPGSSHCRSSAALLPPTSCGIRGMAHSRVDSPTRMCLVS